MKKILCLIDSLRMGGGAERQMAGLANFLHARQYLVHLVTYYDQGCYPELLNVKGLIRTVLKVRKNKFSKLIAVRKYIADNGGFDWVITYKDGPALISCFLKVFGGNFRLMVSERNTNLSLGNKDKIKFFLYKWADVVVPNSYAQKKFIDEHFGNLSNKTRTITNFTDTDYFIPAGNTSTKKINVLTVGRIAKQKNVLNYLAAIRLIKEECGTEKIHFDWFGNVQPGEEEYANLCLEYYKKFNLESILEFHPATNEILKHYQQCDIFCLPSKYEGFPNVICEAMSCGKPIVCSNICDNPSIVLNNVNGCFFDPLKVESIYCVIKKIVSMPKEDRERWGVASRTIAEKMFSKEAFVQKYIDIIESASL